MANIIDTSEPRWVHEAALDEPTYVADLGDLELWLVYETHEASDDGSNPGWSGWVWRLARHAFDKENIVAEGEFETLANDEAVLAMRAAAQEARRAILKLADKLLRLERAS